MLQPFNGASRGLIGKFDVLALVNWIGLDLISDTAKHHYEENKHKV